MSAVIPSGNVTLTVTPDGISNGAMGTNGSLLGNEKVAGRVVSGVCSCTGSRPSSHCTPKINGLHMLG